jgi:hypothetical protein
VNVGVTERERGIGSNAAMVLRAVFQTTAFRCGDNGAVMIVIVAVSFFTERLIKVVRGLINY